VGIRPAAGSRARSAGKRKLEGRIATSCRRSRPIAGNASVMLGRIYDHDRQSVFPLEPHVASALAARHNASLDMRHCDMDGRFCNRSDVVACGEHPAEMFGRRVDSWTASRRGPFTWSVLLFLFPISFSLNLAHFRLGEINVHLLNIAAVIRISPVFLGLLCPSRSLVERAIIAPLNVSPL
jgi:hypothetical protein